LSNRSANVQFSFENDCPDGDRRELRRGTELGAAGPKLFDLLLFLVQNRAQAAIEPAMLVPRLAAACCW
jgi:DNA-binding winged helix-turn-helix (wHTH) protein